MAKATESKAQLNYLKIAPRKVRLIVDALKKLPVQEAEAQLLARPQRSAPAILKLLRSAIANAKNKNLDPAKLFIADIYVNQGPMLKRVMPRAMGRATTIQKKMSHITVILKEKEIAGSQRFNIELPKKPVAAKTKAGKNKRLIAKTKATNTREDVKKEKQEGRKVEEKPGWFKRVFKRKNV